MTEERAQIVRATRPIHAVGTAVCISIVVGAAFVFLVPGMKSRQETREQFDRLAAATERLEAAARSNRSLNAEAARLSESVESRMVTLRPADQLNRVLADLTDLCLSHGVVPEVIQPRDLVPDPVTPIIPIRFEITGRLDVVYELLGVFESQHPDLHLRSITLEHTGPETVRMRTVLSWLTGTTVAAN
ncbi:MAG: hypothetical protein LAT64_03345 [Phycisphaerales bacterium]|nr:hypothetical protein [Planctomycetota bacterium]MCH8507790.1 hypothetical protein [Phycisphaerales bacterium]